MRQPAGLAVARSSTLSARKKKSLQNLRASWAGSRSGHISRHSLRAAEVGLQVGGGGSRGRVVAFHAEGFCSGSVTLVVGGMRASGLSAGIAFLFPTSGRLGQTIKVAALRWLGRL